MGCSTELIDRDRLRAKLMRRVEVTDGCWVWKGPVNKAGYGQIQIVEWERPWLVHRAAYFVFKGDVPTNMFVCHACDNPPCVNPDHLWLGTALDNARDTSRKGRVRTGTGDRHGSVTHPERVPKGDWHGKAKLRSDLIAEIIRRVSAGESMRSVGRSVGVTHTTIGEVVHRRTWRHVDVTTVN